jgi:hypothetical protein
MERYGIEMNPQLFSAIKSRSKGAAPKKAEPAKRGRTPKPLVEGHVAPPPEQPANGSQPT